MSGGPLIRATRGQLLSLLNNLGADFNEDEVESRGVPFGNWEVGFGDACDVFRARVLALVEELEPGE